MTKGGARTTSEHTVNPSPAQPTTEARPASSADPEYGPSHPTSRKPSGQGGGHGNGDH